MHENLGTAPGFEKDNGHDMANSTWGSDVFQHGTAPRLTGPTRKRRRSQAVVCNYV
jgi:hypothetical protein